MYDKTEFLFKMVLLTTKQLKTESKDKDAIDLWTKLDKLLNDYGNSYSNNYGSWNNIDEKLYNYIMSLPEFYIDGYNSEFTFEPNHYLIQTVKIPNEYENICILALIKIAFYCGLYIGLADETYNHMTIRTYVSDEILLAIEKDITYEFMLKLVTCLVEEVNSMEFLLDDVNVYKSAVI